MRSSTAWFLPTPGAGSIGIVVCGISIVEALLCEVLEKQWGCNPSHRHTYNQNNRRVDELNCHLPEMLLS